MTARGKCSSREGAEGGCARKCICSRVASRNPAQEPGRRVFDPARSSRPLSARAMRDSTSRPALRRDSALEENMAMTTRDISTTITTPPHRLVPREAYASQVERALEWLSRNFERQPSLAEAADHVGLSEYHFQRRFRAPGRAEPQEVRPVSHPRAREGGARKIAQRARRGIRLGALRARPVARSVRERRGDDAGRIQAPWEGADHSIRGSPVAVRAVPGHADRPRRVRARVHLSGPVRRCARGACPRLRGGHLHRGCERHRRNRKDDIRCSDWRR